MWAMIYNWSKSEKLLFYVMLHTVIFVKTNYLLPQNIISSKQCYVNDCRYTVYGSV